MADSSGRGPSRGQRLASDSPASSRSAAQNARDRPSSSQNSNDSPRSPASTSNVNGNTLRTPIQALRGQESRFSLNEQFATSRSEFDFDVDGDEDDMEHNAPEHLEPAPIIQDSEIYVPPLGKEGEDDSDSEVDDVELQALLHAVDDSVDYYTLLNLPRDPAPTTAQIRASYHRLSLAFHPDKHHPSMRAAAEKYFTKLQRAYETLVEPRKRVIYDLEGEEGVQLEYREGVMSKNSERQVGVKTMSPDEFRKYYISILSARERKALEDLVGVSGTCKLVFDAQHLFDGSGGKQILTSEDGSGSLEYSFPLVTIRSLSLDQGFGVPLPSIGKFLQNPVSRLSSIIQGDEEEEEDRTRFDDPKPAIGVPKLTFSGGINGDLIDSLAVYSPESEGASEKKDFAPDPVRWQTLKTDNFSISTGLEYAFTNREGKDSLDVDISVDILPKSAVHVGLGSSFGFLKNTRPFYGYIRTTFEQSLYAKPPKFDLRVTRLLAAGHTAYLQFSTGDYAWPQVLQNSLSVAQGPMWLPLGVALPNMRLGWIHSGEQGTLDTSDEEMHFSSQGQQQSKVPSTNQTWQISATASRVNAGINVTYGRDLFMMKPLPPVTSRIMSGGDTVNSSSLQPKLETTPRGIRFQIEGELDLKLSLSGTVRGLRRIGDFTTIGVGVGLNLQRGLFVSLSWKRLAQSISLPIILVPVENVTTKATVWALTVPWMAYLSFEFVILRPRFRRKRRRLIERKRRELISTVEQRRKEAEEAVRLMTPLVEYKQAWEREHGGLVIIKATFGVPEPKKASSETVDVKTAESAEVSTAIAALVEDSQVAIPRGLQKSQLVGFWDPAPLSRKVLAVKYLYGGKEHWVEVDGGSALRLPARQHEVV